jgi:hypothetical protein
MNATCSADVRLAYIAICPTVFMMSIRARVAVAYSSSKLLIFAVLDVSLICHLQHIDQTGKFAT